MSITSLSVVRSVALAGLAVMTAVTHVVAGQVSPAPPPVLITPHRQDAPPTVALLPDQQPPNPPPPGQGGQRPQGPPPGDRQGGQQPQQIPPPPARRGQPVNIKVDVTITDQRGSNPALTKQVSLTLADQEPGRIRSEGEVFQYSGEPNPGNTYNVPLNLDIRPEMVSDTRVKVFIGLEYDNVETSVEKGRRPRNNIRETASVILDSGKPLVISQSADPLTDRKVTVEVKATVLR